MKLKLLIALIAVPSLVMAQIYGPSAPNPADFGSTGKSAGGVPTPPIYTSPNMATGSSTTPSSSDLSTSGYRPTESVSSSAPTGSSSGKSTSTNVGGIYMDFDSSGKSTSTNVGGKADKYGTTGPDREQTATNSNKATGSSAAKGSYTPPEICSKVGATTYCSK